jgi:hypothetical protein
MSLTVRTTTSPTRRFAVWAIGPWLLLFIAAMGCLQYFQHADYAYLAAAMGIIVVCAGCILRQAWARNTMRVLAVLLALWALVTGIMMLQQWGDFERARQDAMTQQQPQLGEIALWLIARAKRTYAVGLALKAIAIPLLLWLSWQLGRPSVCAQFKKRRR